jgi:hypothetical protein
MSLFNRNSFMRLWSDVFNPVIHYVTNGKYLACRHNMVFISSF